jgi:hypothetical protein
MVRLDLINRSGERMLFAVVADIAAARELWTKVAGVDAGQELNGFEVYENSDEPEARLFPLYKGNYVTDEC